MQDEHFMQGWNDNHNRFSADLDRGLGRLIDRLPHRARRAEPIGNPYGIPTEAEPRPALSAGAQASLRGFAATVITATLWVVVMVLATPAPGLAASPEAPVANVECIARPLLA